MDPREPEELSLVKSKHRNQNCGLKKIVLGGRKENEARKTFRKVMKAFGRVEFAQTHQKKVQAVISTRTKAEAKIRKKSAKNVLILNQDFQPLKSPLKKDKAVPRSRRLVFQHYRRFLNFNNCVVQFKKHCMDGISPFGSCPPSDARCCGSWLHMVTCIKNCNQKVPATPPYSTRVDVHETGDVPIPLSLPQMKNLGMIIGLDP